MNPLPMFRPGPGSTRSSTLTGVSRAIPTDFIGASTITVAVAGEPRRLDGSGDLTDRGLEFHQQDAADAAGTDVAAWAIAEDGDETFWAEPLGAG